ncbi:M23 family metallopeptidase, partial [candidate division WWE3 bacterium]|nr:M23 family metallopeptidase [candidate division WWE3 bacterium]
GLYRSTDKGLTWEKVDSWANNITGPIAEVEGVIYAGRWSSQYDTYGVFESRDNGYTWFDISSGLFDKNANIISIGGVYSQPNKVFISSTQKGVYAHEIKDFFIDKPFLDLPWSYIDFNKDAQRIYSFFDHKYPLLGYYYKKEPTGTETSTLNFKGIEKGEPEMYYSSHNGIDFTLPYGTEILAPASGYASYSLSQGGGNTIKIDHGNGLQTWYLHLQKNGLVVSEPEKKVFMNKLDKIGLVGLTGNTTGPHLHFTVLKDKNDNAVFDDFPDGLTDPYGWRDKQNNDPWEFFEWTDALGPHKGAASSYLWTRNLDMTSSLILSSAASIFYNNKTVIFPAGLSRKIFTSIVSDAIVGRGGPAWPSSLNLEQTGTSVEAIDPTGEPINSFANDFTLQIDYGDLAIGKITESTLKVYKRSKENGDWTEVPTAIDTETKIISAQSNMTGEFAVFGLPADVIPPTTTYALAQRDGLVLLTLTATDNEGGLGVENIFYSTNEGDGWEEYTSPLTVDPSKFSEILFKSLDKGGNMEDPKSASLHDEINTFEKKVLIVDFVFSTGIF